jgi:hypothetical protein
MLIRDDETIDGPLETSAKIPREPTGHRKRAPD